MLSHSYYMKLNSFISFTLSYSASEMTYIVSSGALNSTHSLTLSYAKHSKDVIKITLTQKHTNTI